MSYNDVQNVQKKLYPDCIPSVKTFYHWRNELSQSCVNR